MRDDREAPLSWNHVAVDAHTHVLYTTLRVGGTFRIFIGNDVGPEIGFCAPSGGASNRLLQAPPLSNCPSVNSDGLRSKLAEWNPSFFSLARRKSSREASGGGRRYLYVWMVLLGLAAAVGRSTSPSSPPQRPSTLFKLSGHPLLSSSVVGARPAAVFVVAAAG